MQRFWILISLMSFCATLASAQSAPENMNIVKNYSEKDSIQKFGDLVFSNRRGRAVASETFSKLAAGFRDKDEVTLVFQYDEAQNRAAQVDRLLSEQTKIRGQIQSLEDELQKPSNQKFQSQLQAKIQAAKNEIGSLNLQIVNIKDGAPVPTLTLTRTVQFQKGTEKSVEELLKNHSSNGTKLLAVHRLSSAKQILRKSGITGLASAAALAAGSLATGAAEAKMNSSQSYQPRLKNYNGAQ